MLKEILESTAIMELSIFFKFQFSYSWTDSLGWSANQRDFSHQQPLCRRCNTFNRTIRRRLGHRCLRMTRHWTRADRPPGVSGPEVDLNGHRSDWKAGPLWQGQSLCLWVPFSTQRIKQTKRERGNTFQHLWSWTQWTYGILWLVKCLNYQLPASNLISN